MKTEKFIEDAISIHNNKYNYSLVEYINCKTKVDIICKIHGTFQQRASHHMDGRGCVKCSDNRLCDSTFIERSNNIHNNKYDYSLVEYINYDTKVDIICKTHGTFQQTPNKHLSGKGCLKCGYLIVRNSKYPISSVEYQNDVISRVNNIHNNKYDYSLVKYINCKTRVDIICNIHGIFKQSMNSHLSGKGCPLCKSSSGEMKIVNVLNKIDIEYLTEYSFKDLINPRSNYKLRFDFYLPRYNMCIEYDGKQHFETIKYFGGDVAFNNRRYLDKIKDKYCNDNDIILLRIPYWDFNDIEKIIKDNVK